MNYDNLNNTQKKELRKKLKLNGKNICFGPQCKGKIKQQEEFVKNINVCRECNRHNNNEYYKKNGNPCKRTKKILKNDQSCVNCGCDDPLLLQFDHLDQSTKKFNIGRASSSTKLINEAKKTQFLCIWCHRLKSKKQIEENCKKSKKD